MLLKPHLKDIKVNNQAFSSFCVPQVGNPYTKREYLSENPNQTRNKQVLECVYNNYFEFLVDFGADSAIVNNVAYCC